MCSFGASLNACSVCTHALRARLEAVQVQACLLESAQTHTRDLCVQDLSAILTLRPVVQRGKCVP